MQNAPLGLPRQKHDIAIASPIGAHCKLWPKLFNLRVWGGAEDTLQWGHKALTRAGRGHV